MPKVSVIMPSLNVAPYIRECIESVINQTLKDIEIICVDAGSTDGTLEILQEYAQEDSRINLIFSDKKSYGYQMNLGINAAKSDYIGVVETDDYVDLRMFGNLYDLAVKYNVDIIKADFNNFRGELEERTFTYRPLYNNKKFYNRVLEPSINDEVFNFNILTWAGLHKREFLNEFNIRHNESPGASYQDNGFWFQEFTQARRVYFVDYPYYQHRMDNPDSSINSKSKAYCICDEYDFIRTEFLNKHPQLKSKYIYLYSKKRFGNYDFTLQRIADEFKYEFLMRFSEDLKKAYGNGEIDENLFSKSQIQKYRDIMKDPQGYYFKAFYKNTLKDKRYEIEQNDLKIQLIKTKENLKFAQKEIVDIRSSYTYKIGRVITWIPRKGRGIVRCFREHNWSYTWRRCLEHVGIPMGIQLIKRSNRVDAISNNNKKRTDQINTKQILLQDEEIKSTNRTIKKDYNYYISLPPEKYPEELCDWYKSIMGEEPNLNNPRSFNEKIQWLKLFDSTPIKSRLADKYLVREWVADKIGEEYLVPLIGVWDSFDEIDFDTLPNQFALKANHGSGWNIIVSDKSDFDKNNARSKFNKWFSKNYAFYNGFELHYSSIKPRVICEQYIQNTNGLIDYRFYCFNGEPKQVWVDIFSGTPNHKRDIFDLSWNRIPVKCKWPSGEGLLDKKPELFEQMVEKARILSQGFTFVRVDFFEVEKKLYFGEMTFTPMSGAGKFDPKKYDIILGNMLSIPPKEQCVPNFNELELLWLERNLNIDNKKRSNELKLKEHRIIQNNHNRGDIFETDLQQTSRSYKGRFVTWMLRVIGRAIDHLTRGDNREIDIVFISDDNYAMPTAVAITSIFINKLKKTNYNIYILSVGISEENKKRLSSLSKKKFKVNIINIELNKQQKSVKKSRERVTHAALLKFELPNIFSKLERILYLDCDVLVQRDIKELYSMDVSNYYAAVVKDTISTRGKNSHLKRIGFKLENYFNSGVLLLNLNKMRKDNMPKKLLDYRLNGKNTFMDQDALNVVFNGKVRYISPYFNLLNCFFEWQPIEELKTFYDIDFPDNVIDVYRKAVILHLGDTKKPWLYDMGYLSDIYKIYHSKSPFADKPLKLKK